MKITALVENTTINKKLKSSHGLSLYIETTKHKLLIDTGSNKLFLENAKKLNIDISAVDILIITHGHFDHGGGLEAFLAVNKKAQIYIQRKAFNDYYIRLLKIMKINIGLKKELEKAQQVVLVDGDYQIDEQLMLITNPSEKELLPKNDSLLEKKDNKFIKDEFMHEQSIIIKETTTVVIGGCAHRGIVNIIDYAIAKLEHPIAVCISGFHLFNVKHNENILKLAERLKKYDITFYTCHCTGIKPYKILKEQMADHIKYLSAGQTIII